MKNTKGKWVVSPSWSYRKGVSAKDTIQNEPDGYSVDAHVERKTLGGQDSPYDIAIASMQTYSNGKRPMDEVKANANLIASAPEMLDALRMAAIRIADLIYKMDGETVKKDGLTGIRGKNGEDELDEIYRLIAKAEGE